MCVLHALKHYIQRKNLTTLLNGAREGEPRLRKSLPTEATVTIKQIPHQSPPSLLVPYSYILPLPSFLTIPPPPHFYPPYLPGSLFYSRVKELSDEYPFRKS